MNGVFHSINSYHPELLPLIFKDTFPKLNTLSCIFCVCKTWTAQKEITWRAIIQDSNSPIFRRYEILISLSIWGNRANNYHRIPAPSHATNTTFLKEFCPYTLDDSDFENLRKDDELERAFAWSKASQQQKLIQHLINKVGYKRCMQLILLFNEGERLTDFCFAYIYNGAENLDLLAQLQNENLPSEDDLENFLRNPFIRSLNFLKEHDIEDDVFIAYIECCLIPTLDYFCDLRPLFEILPADFSFSSYGETQCVFDFFENFIAPISICTRKGLNNNYQNFIAAIEKIPHPHLRRQLAESHLNRFYIDERAQWNDSYWPILYRIERELGCKKKSIEDIQEMLINQKSFSQAFTTNLFFSLKFSKLIQSQPDLLDEILKEDLQTPLEDDYLREVFSDILMFLNHQLLPYSIRQVFINSAPKFLKSYLLQLDLESLITQNQFQEDFERSHTPELQAALLNSLIAKIGYRALEVIFLFTQGKSLTDWCILYLTKGAENLDLLLKLAKGIKPFSSDLESFLQHPFLISLEPLKQKNLDVHVFDTYIRLMIIPTLNYFPQLKALFSILPNDFSFSLASEANRNILLFFDNFLNLTSIEDPENFIKTVQQIPHPKLQNIMAIDRLDLFYSKYESSPENTFYRHWQHLYKIEHSLNCHTIQNETGSETFYFDRSTETFIEYLFLEEMSFNKAFSSHPQFAKAVGTVLEKRPHLLTNIIEELEEQNKSTFKNEYKNDVIFDILVLLNNQLKPHYVLKAFIDSAPEFLKPHLRQLCRKDSIG